ncbi:MAG: hypothetical protein IJH12_08590 [Clostridia bacterium]|nr:hypothetical protein [Clostridia bacterium]
MVDKILITNKLQNYFNKTNLDSFLKVFVISYFYDKLNYMEPIVGNDNCLNMFDKYVYNMEKNIKFFKKVEKYHSIYAKYDFDSKTLKYYMTNEYKNTKGISESSNNQKQIIIKEFKIMMYKEFDKVVNIHIMNQKVISNGFYFEDKEGRYPDYNGHFSNIMDIFSEVEVCKITGVDDKIKNYIDQNKKYFVYSNHISKTNSEVMCYAELWRKFIDEKLYYFAVNNPKKYAEKMIEDFNSEYEFVLNGTYQFMLENKNVFALIENYLLHIKDRADIEHNAQYHQELSIIFSMMNNKRNINNFKDYVLHGSAGNRLMFENI